MGGATSRFEETDWKKSNGQLESLSDTIDGCPPTHKYDVYELIKRGVNQREFDIVDSQQNLLYTTRAVPGTLAWFDVLGPGSVGQYKDFRLRVQVDLSRRTWIVYRYSKPLYSWQKPALKCTPQVTNSSRSPRGGNKVGDGGGPVLPLRYDLYKTAHITVSWSRYIAIAARYGPPPEDHYSSHLALQDSCGDHEGADDDNLINEEKKIAGGDGADKEGDLFQEASKIAARRRGSAEEGQDDSIPSLHEEARSMPTLADKDDEDKASVLTHESDELPCTPKQDVQEITTASLLASAAQGLCKTNCLASTDPPTSPKSTEHDAQTIIESASPQSNKHRFVQDAATISSVYGNLEEDAGTRVKQYFVSQSKSWSQLFGSSGSDSNHDGEVGESIGENGSGKSSAPSKTKLQRERRRQLYESALEGVIQLDDAPILQCQEIYNKIIGNHQTSIVTKQDVITLLALDRKEHESEISQQRESSRRQRKGEEGYAQHVTVDDDMENISDGLNDDDDNDSLVAAAIKEERNSFGNSGFTSATAAQRISVWASKLGLSMSMSSIDNSEHDTLEEESDNAGACGRESKAGKTTRSINRPPVITNSSDSMPSQQQDKVKESPPLVAYWAWKNTIRTHKIQMHLSKNSDLALHVVLAILVNQVRCERNAIAMTV